MPQLLHLRVGRFFQAAALGRAEGLATILELTARLDELAHRSCRAIEWFSATEAWCDLGTGRDGVSPWVVADQLHAEIKSGLAVEVACGVASTRSASRAASAMARPSGLVVVLPGYEAALLDIARKEGVIIDATRDDVPLKPSLVPRAIVRSMHVNLNSDDDLHDALAILVRDARQGLSALGVLTASIRVQFIGTAGAREAFASLPDATSIGELLVDTADRLARRIAAGATGAGRLSVSLSQLILGPSQGSLFGWRYDHRRDATERPA
jgi:hypothetical protein